MKNLLNFLNRKSRWTNIELGMLKICLVSVGLAVGAFFHEQVSRCYILLLVLYLLTGTWAFLMWLKQMRKKNDSDLRSRNSVLPNNK